MSSLTDDGTEPADAQFAEAAAEVYGGVNYAHPFRDGNGRAARAFMDAVARNAGRWLDYSAIPKDAWVQRSAFSIPDLDQDPPQNHWLTTVFAVMAARHSPLTLEIPYRSPPRLAAKVVDHQPLWPAHGFD
jgi:cell filamentation protein, protein adenylyltransferase